MTMRTVIEGCAIATIDGDGTEYRDSQLGNGPRGDSGRGSAP